MTILQKQMLKIEKGLMVLVVMSLIVQGFSWVQAWYEGLAILIQTIRLT